MRVHWQIEEVLGKRTNAEEETIFVNAKHEECRQFGVREREGKDDTGDLDGNNPDPPAYQAFERNTQTTSRPKAQRATTKAVVPDICQLS